MTTGLAVSDIVNVSVNLQPLAAQLRNFGQAIILGSSSVIDVSERIRSYSGITGVAADFSNTMPEYLAAQLFFSQSPQPATLQIGRWAQNATAGRLNGGLLATGQQVLTNFTVITAGSLHFTIDAVAHDVTAINFSSATNLNGVASILQAALVAQTSWTGVTVVWDASYKRFLIKSGTTGTTSTVSFASAAATGTDISALLCLTSATGANQVGGIAAESLLTCVNLLADMSSGWYGMTVATNPAPSISDHVAAAGAIEAQGFSRIYAITTQDPNVLNAQVNSDVASQLQALNYKRTCTQYSSSNPYAITSALARAFTVNFEGSLTTMTLKFKQEPGVTPENLNESQYQAAKSKNCNVFVNFNNSTAILQEGVMANGYFFDEVHGTDWLQNRVQTDLWNLLYQSPTKIPQTDAGTHLLVTTIQASLAQAVTNGLVAPGVWNAAGFGQLAQFDTLTAGYYVYAPPVSTQIQADREARKSVPIQCAIKLAGAIHFAGVAINVNR